MIDLLKPLLHWTSLPRQTVDAEGVIIAGNEPTSMLFCLEDGFASGADGTQPVCQNDARQYRKLHSDAAADLDARVGNRDLASREG